jgi:hypothetical protein
MLKEKIVESSNKYFETMEMLDSKKDFGDISPWIFNFYKGNVIGATIMAEPPSQKQKQEACMHILNLLSFDKFDTVTISMDTYFTKQSKEDFENDSDTDVMPSESPNREEAIITIGATKNDIDQSMLVYGRNDDGSVYEKEHITEQGVSGGWMQELLFKCMRMDITMEQMIRFARSETDIFDEDEDVEDEVLINNIKQEWIDLLTQSDCIVAFSEVTTSFNDLDGYSIVDLSESDEEE